MKPQGDPSLQPAERQKRGTAMIKGMGYLYDRLDRGESIEEIAIAVDISAAGGALSEAWHVFLRGALEEIRVHRERGIGRTEAMLRLRKDIISVARMLGAGRNEVMTYAGKSAKALCKIPQAEQLVFGFAERDDCR
jgi:hypothetical protein